MINLLSKTAVIFGLLAFSFLSWPHYPAPYPAPAPQYPVCPYNQSSVCYTYNGNACSMFVPNYQNNWFSACLSQGYFHACLNLPAFPLPWAQNACYFRGTPCVCSFGLYNGYYVYEPGQVL